MARLVSEAVHVDLEAEVERERERARIAREAVRAEREAKAERERERTRLADARTELRAGAPATADCQSALDWDPLSASKRDPFERRVLAVALAPSELAGVAETARARAGT